jgi:hypothetical protein
MDSECFHERYAEEKILMNILRGWKIFRGINLLTA